MTDTKLSPVTLRPVTLSPVPDSDDLRRHERRRFFQLAGGLTLAAGLAACGGGDDDNSPTPTPTPSGTASPTPTPSSTVATDVDYLNFALQLQYLEAQYYAWATTGAGVPASLLTGAGTQGAVTGGAQVTFSDALLGQYAREIAAGELAHLGFLRSTLGTAAAAQPAIDISASATGGFTRLARAAGIVGPADTFNPYASELNFLLGAFMIQDVVTTAYIAAVPKFANLLFVNASANILATKSFHASLIRSQLYARGAAARTSADQISNARDGLDGASDLDQGLTGTAAVANVTPADGNGLVPGRTPGQTLNVLYTTASAVVGGGFYPNGIISTYFASSAAS